MTQPQLTVENIKLSELRSATYNPRKWDEQAIAQLTESIKNFGIVDPAIVNGSELRKNIVIGGHFRIEIAKRLGYKEFPVVFLDIPDIKREKELNLRLNKNTGEFDYSLLAEFDEKLLEEIGFSSEELDEVFEVDLDNPEEFDIDKELAKMDIDNIEVKKGDVWQLGEHRLICGDATDPEAFNKLMDGKKKLGLKFPNDNTKPSDYAELFPEEGSKTYEGLYGFVMKYDRIIIKSCYPNSNIKSNDDLEQTKDDYTQITSHFNSVGKQLIIMTSPPLRPTSTTPENASRARELATWLASQDFGENILVFDFFSPLASDEGVLKKEYRRLVWLGNHPNAKASRDIAPKLVAELV